MAVHHKKAIVADDGFGVGLGAAMNRYAFTYGATVTNAHGADVLGIECEVLRKVAYHCAGMNDALCAPLSDWDRNVIFKQGAGLMSSPVHSKRTDGDVVGDVCAIPDNGGWMNLRHDAGLRERTLGASKFGRSF